MHPHVFFIYPWSDDLLHNTVVCVCIYIYFDGLAGDIIPWGDSNWIVNRTYKDIT